MKVFTFIIFLLGIPFLEAQSINGSVYHAETTQPIANANILIEGTAIGVASATDGSFTLPLPQSGGYHFLVTAVGFADWSKNIQVEENEDVHINIVLEPDVLTLNRSIVITAERDRRESFRRSEAISVFSARQMQERIPRTTPEALSGIPGIWVQKTNHGGGSPFIRGLTGNQTLLLVDGVRLNNATFRYGPNQYLNTVDPFSLTGIEALRGAGSVQYGSDALGGTVQMLTKSPSFASKGFRAGANFTGIYMTDDMEKTGRVEAEAASENLALHTGFSFRDFGHLDAGGNLGIEAPSAYDEWSADLKMIAAPSPYVLGTVAFQYTRQKEVPRFDQVSQRGYEWYNFEPQIRQLAYGRIKYYAGLNWAKEIELTISDTRSIEGRMKKKADSVVEIRERDEVTTIGLSLQIKSQPNQWWNVVSGLEWSGDEVSSSRTDHDNGSGSIIYRRGLYPDGSASTSISLFTLHTMKADYFQVEAGLRYGFYSVRAVDELFGNRAINPSAFVGSIALLYEAADWIHPTVAVRAGFRAPNINDMSSFGAFDYGVEVPSDNLAPERSLTIEAGLKIKTNDLSGEIALYHTRLSDLIGREPSTYMGSESYAGDRVYKKQNIADAFIRGAELHFEWSPFHRIRTAGFIVYTYGENEIVGEPLRRIPPLNAGVSARYSFDEGLNAEFEWLFAQKQDRLSPGDVEDPRIPGGGTPGWNVINLSASYEFWYLRASLRLLNLFDEAYRIHGSGIDGYGRALRFGLSLRL